MVFNLEPDAAADDPATIMMFDHECLSNCVGPSRSGGSTSSFMSIHTSDRSIWNWHLVVFLFLSFISGLSL